TLVGNITEAIAKENPATLEDANKLNSGEGTIESEIISATTTIGEKISLRRFVRFEKTEGETFGSYLHMGGRIGVLVHLDAADKEDVARDVAMHIAAINPLYITRDEVPADKIEHETKV